MEKLLGVYTMYVYANGKIELKEVSTSHNSVCTDGASSSIRQVVKVIEHVAISKSSNGIRRKVSEGINAVAKSEGINISSVHAKITRKLKLSMEEFKDLVESYFNGKDDQLENVLRNSCVARSKAADTAAIDSLIRILKTKSNEQ